MESIETQVLPAWLADSTRGSGEVPVGRRVIGLLQRSPRSDLSIGVAERRIIAR